VSAKDREKTPEIRIAPADPEDAQGMAEVFYKTWLATYPNKKAGITTDDIEDRFKDSFTEESLAKRAERIAIPREGETSFLAKDGDRIVGVCHIVRHPDKNELQAIYILPEYQGKGVGGLLWGEAQKHFTLDKDIIVQVATYNTNAIAFYKKLGFQETGKEFQNERFRMKSGAVIPETEMVIRIKNELSQG
jgi:ribosomal protein S18 acetylase RimI-like enzyme